MCVYIYIYIYIYSNNKCMCVFLISPVPITEPLTSELIDTPDFYNLAPRPIKYRVSVPIPRYNIPVFRWRRPRLHYPAKSLWLPLHSYPCSERWSLVVFRLSYWRVTESSWERLGSVGLCGLACSLARMPALLPRFCFLSLRRLRSLTGEVMIAPLPLSLLGCRISRGIEFGFPMV